ncbi:MAG TPA: SDR family NAD(P)-dependent oxidoreductase [Bacilli bacterium]|jgi:3-oxoacyl-[acyl-carrier protein] reductase|nr:MAG: 3-oxoacyl-(acyl-carrier-protein) reductase FabG [Tenericutes bacterium ADurb.Bin140]HON64362.1 SDR family NAD(P)-dependent oxidoreductase [Bacilli bacterium]HOR96315.1 SDR family NAD(P)-dependent oxidoreductase [Bacilli bacterium]HPN90902.1 SDR family NAD(P)-dependent oxidoreductase [Bacilli bacterium]HRS30902.1 SDR family NAD(P)-dependent oxidoreductase [Bacilli bacterium]
MSKVVLVTGSAKGIGAAIIEELAAAGYDCVINYHTSEKEAFALQEKISKFNVRSLVIKCDVSKEDDVNRMVDSIEKELGGVDILVNNAGIDLPNLFDKKTAADFRKVLDVNLIGAFLTSKRVAGHMITQKWGRIINISSTNGINTYYPMGLEYDASKAALISLTHNLAIQFAPYVNVNAIAPGLINTENEIADYDEDFMQAELAKILKRRIGEAREVAQLVKFLVSEAADYINNTVIRIDGGHYQSF